MRSAARRGGRCCAHVWPNITAPIIIIYSITIGCAIIAEASLSFLGFGLPPDVPSWGTMLSRGGRQYMEMAPRLAMWPRVALTGSIDYQIQISRLDPGRQHSLDRRNHPHGILQPIAH